MATIKFEESEYPTTPASKSVNPHVPMVQDMVKTNTSRRVTLPNKTDKDKADIKSLISYVQAAGREVGVTVNKQVVESDDKSTVSVYFKVREKITRTRLNKR